MPLVLLDLPLMISSVADTDLQHDSYAYNPPEIFVFNSICEGIFLMIFDNGVATGCKRGRLVPPIAWQKRCNEKIQDKGEREPGKVVIGSPPTLSLTNQWYCTIHILFP